MTKKRILLGTLVLGMVLGLSGCGTLFRVSMSKPVETETSKMFLDAANDLLLDKDNGLAPSLFKNVFERKFPGVTIQQFNAGGLTSAGTGTVNMPSSMTFTYQDKKYVMNLSNNGESGAAVRITAAASCGEKS